MMPRGEKRPKNIEPKTVNKEKRKMEKRRDGRGSDREKLVPQRFFCIS